MVPPSTLASQLALDQMTLASRAKHAMLQKIATGGWTAGMQLPPEQRLAEEYGMSQGTIRKALEFLERSRFIVRMQGKGTFVNDPCGKDIQLSFDRIRAISGAVPTPSANIIQDEEGAADEAELHALRLKTGSPVKRISVCRSLADRPYMYDRLTMPLQMFESLSHFDGSETSFFAVAQQNGLLLGEAEETLTAEPCPAAVAHTLGIQDGAAVMRMKGLLRTVDGRAVRLRDAFCVTANVSYSVALTRY